MALSENQLFGLAFGGLTPIAIGALLVLLRDDIDNTNLALILVLVVVIAAIVGGRAAGALAAVTSTLAFDFFLTKPFLSARIDSADDLETAVILLAVGLLVGEVASRGRRARQEHEAAAQAILRVHRVADQIAHDTPIDVVLASVKAELLDLLSLWDCWLELRPFTWVLPRMDRGGTVEGDEHTWLTGGFVLPRDGVELPVVDRGTEVARLVLLGDPEVPVTLEQRVVAVALADQLGIAVALAPTGELAHLAVGPDDIAGGRERTDPDG
ncbi:MAG: hypothetical protein QOF40_612 [Actinomycetota bacterium]|nr:hypothetical protein [Actinomycetota bacterium]